MKSIRRLLTPVLFLMIMAVALPSCLDKEDENTTIYQNIVTFVRNGGDNRVYFEYQQVDDSPTVSLFTTGSIDESVVPAGSRLLMRYTLSDGMKYGESGQVSVLGLQQVTKSTITQAPTEEAKAANASIYLVTFYRSGKYLNLVASLPLVEDREFLLVADESTVGTTNPVLYLTTTTASTNPGANTQYVASIDIENFWSAPTTEKLTVHINNTANPTYTKFDFTK